MLDNICILGPARSRTSLLGDVCRQAKPKHAFFYEPGLVTKYNKNYLEYFQARKWSREEIDNLKGLLQRGGRVVFKTVAGATYFDLTEDDLRCFADHCKIVLATRNFSEAIVSYIAAMKTRFFNKDNTEFLGTITYEPMFDDARLFWYTGYYIQAIKWRLFLEKTGAQIQVVDYSEASDYITAAKVLGFSDVTLVPKIVPPHSRPYSELFTNYDLVLKHRLFGCLLQRTRDG
jgi:hypothetical protein